MDSTTGSGPRTDRRRNGDEDAFAALRSGPFGASADDSDPWSWAAEEPLPAATRDVSSAHVTAVLVAFDAARWLGATLDGLEALTRRPERLIAVDNGSDDATRTLLERARDAGLLHAVYAGRRGSGFGDAVRSALEQDRAAVLQDSGTRLLRPGTGHESRWLWLLHDDAIPAPDALQQLLAHVLGERIDITGPKLLLPRRRQAGQQISEVGVSISGTGRRELGVDVGEIDQGQRDEPVERLGVSTCGLLIRTAVWNDLDGLDPALPVFRDGVELGWRAHLNGYRVVTTPQAEMTHRQVGRAGLRPRGVAGRRPGRLDRLLGMVVVAGHAPARSLPLVWLRLVWSCLVHAVGYLVGKVPGRALDEVLALASFVAHPGRIHALRKRTATIEPAPGTAEVVQALRPPWWSSLRVAAEAVNGALSDRYRSVAGDVEGTSLDELTGDDFATVAEDRSRNPWLSPVVLTLLLTVVGSLVAARGVLGTGSLAGPALLPAQQTLGALWASVWDPVPGAPGQSSPPWLALAAVASTVLAGRPEWFTTLMVGAVVPLALLVAYPVVRRVVADRRLRLWVALTYALLPALLGGTNQGRLSLSVVALTLPLLAAAARALVLRRVRTPEAWRGAWGAGVALVVLVAFEPSLMVFALVAGAAGAIALRRTPRKIGRIGIALGLPLVVLLPWWPSLILEPGRLLVGPDAALQGAPAAPEVWQLALGRDVGPGLPPLWLGAVVFGVIWALALGGLLRRSERRLVVVCWFAALLALALAVVLSRLVVPVPPLGAEVRPWVGPHLLVAFGALALGGAAGVDGLSRDVGRRSFSWLQPAAVLGGVAVALVTVGGAAWWIWAGLAGPVDRVGLEALPPYVRNAMVGDTRARVLAVDLAGDDARFAVLADRQLRLGDADRGGTFGGSSAAQQQAQDLVVRLVAGTADSDIAPQLADLGIGYVWVRGATEEEGARIDNTPGLGAASGDDGAVVWRLEPPVSRTTVVDGTARTPVAGAPLVLPPGAEGRQLLLGEAADRRWEASLDGRPLTPVVAGWQQGFVLPAAGGQLTWSLPSVSHWFLFAQGLLLVVAGVLAAPAIRRPEVRDPAKSARRAATLAEVS
ncbi:Glycosyltransferase, GT2 family [Friedmanniella luteola]|uniref:Glycosyltransferase, GT2 family n=1 Tax=Friedmanniella luteola TaxID=546871 RepID=A0A1H1YFV1_9ACTN|nr:glycosyltransferase [Friedmanniella luteola]SDT20340.1 Glycosyltransferase, GT2 family [Friedmanniella luteola]